MKKYKNIIRCLKWGVFFTILYFVGRAITIQIIQIDWATVKFDWIFLCLSIIFEIMARFLGGILYTSLLNIMKLQLPIKIPISISWISQLGKYIPGKVAFLSSTIYFFNMYKIRPAIATFVPVLANMITIWIALMLSLPLFFSLLEGQIAPFLNMALMIIAISGIICFQPSVLLMLGNFLLKKMGSPPLEITIGFFKILPSWGVVFFQCVCAGIAAWCMVKTIAFAEPQQIPIVISVAALAGTLGLLALFSPAGIGVREGIYLLTLTPVIGSQKAALFTVLIRLMQTIVDVVMAISGFLILQNSHDRKNLIPQWDVRK
jgi:glycosyltransferase 2 family protein